MTADELGGLLEATGVRFRASLPTERRPQLAILLPVLIAGLGLLALAGAIPALFFGAPRSRIAGSVVLMTLCAAGVAYVVKTGGLSWPGLDAWEYMPRLEIKK